ncbi:hypothetical protein L7F22_009524 [Adiantum nelumboides]|nr:hypothetical protein [Adiantum nelumboides]
MAPDEAPAPLSCAQCETSPAIVECLDEELLYCSPCSSALHGKKARIHHIVKPFRTCDECEAAVARLQCVWCAGKQNEPLVFCADCSGTLHSKKARLHHRVEAISSPFITNSSVQNDVKAGGVQEGGFHVKTQVTTFARIEKSAISVDLQQGFMSSSKPVALGRNNLEASCSIGSVEVSKEGGTQKEAHLFNGKTAPQQAYSQTDTLTTEEGDGHIKIRCFSLHDTSPGDTLVGTKEEKVEFTNTESELGENDTNQVSVAQVDMSSLEKGAQVNTKRVITNDASLMCPITNMSETAPLEKSLLAERSVPTIMQEINRTVGPLLASMDRQHHDFVSYKTQEAIKSTAMNGDADASTAGSPATSTPSVSHLYQSTFQGSHPLPSCQNHLYSGCTPLLSSVHHMAEGIWPVRTLDFTRNAFHDNVYNAGCVPPPCQSCAPGDAQLYMRCSSQCYSGFTARVDCSSSQLTPPIALSGISDSIHSKSDNQHVSTSNKRVRSVSSKIDALPPNNIEGVDCDLSVSKRMHVGDSLTRASLLKQIREEAREGLSSQNVMISSEEPSKRSHHTSLEDVFSLGKIDTAGSLGEATGQRDFENKCSETDLSKVTTASLMSAPSIKDNSAPKHSRHRLQKMRLNHLSRATVNPLLDRDNEKDSSGRDSSESSHDEEDTSAEDESFHTKKYRKGSITLEAFARIGDARDQSYKFLGPIYSMLKRGLHCNTPDEDASQALRNAHRKVTRYNLKQAGAREGSLQNVEALIPGSCVVEFVSTGSSQRGRLDCWTYSLAQTVANYFATEYCSQKLKVIFYGIAQNANCAGAAFASTFNRISVFSADYVPEKLLDAGDMVEIDRKWDCPNKGVFSRKSRMAYKDELKASLFKTPKSQRSLTIESVNVSVFPTHRIWMKGISKHSSLVKRYGYETIEALILHCRKTCKTFVEMQGWTINSSRLKDPILW